MKSDLEKFRSRWKRWLGQKTRVDKPYWTTLLNNNWMGWASKVLDKNNLDSINLGVEATCSDVKHYFKSAIDCADMKDLFGLDSLYCQEKINNS